METPASSLESWASPRNLILAFVGLSVALAWNALRNPFILDDLTKIVGNPDIRSLANIPAKLVYPYHDFQVIERNDPSRPLVFLVYTLVHAMAGENPFAYHLVNALVHGLSAFFVFGLARKLLEKSLGARATWGAGLASLFFLVAPIQMGTVIYAYGLSDVLAGLFILASLYFACDENLDSRWKRFSLGAMVCALACKQSAIVVPALVLLYDFCFKESATFGTRLKRCKSYFVVAALYLIVRFAYFGGIGDFEGGQSLQSWGDYVTIEPFVILKYLWLALVPHGLSIDHALIAGEFSVPLRLFGVLGLVGLSVWFCRARGSKLACFGWFWFLICLAPTSSFVPTVDLLVERRVYPAAFGLVLLLVLGYEKLRERLNIKLIAGLALAQLLSYGGVSLARNTEFRDPEQAWRTVLEVYPRSYRALNSLANLLVDRKDYAGGVALYERLIELNPKDFYAVTNLGSLYADDVPLKDYDKALLYFQKAIAINPALSEVYYNIGRIYQNRGRLDDALAMYQNALRLKPTHVPSLNNVGAVYLILRRPKDALPLLQEALRLDPGYAPAVQNMRYIEATGGSR